MRHLLVTVVRRRRDRITVLHAALLAVAIGAAYAAVYVGTPAPARAQGRGSSPGGPFGPGGPGGRGPGQPERKIVAQFDKNSDGRLDGNERQAAREWLETNGGGRPGFGGRGRRGMATPSPGLKLAPEDVRRYENEPLYDVNTLRTIFLQFEDADWEQELAAFHNTDVEVPATVGVDGRTYRDVGVHFRGASSFMMVPQGLKRSLNLSFDFVHGKQSLGGYRTLNLLNANGDPTFVRGVLYAEIAQSYIPTPKTNYMRVVINGESWGIYVNTQQFNRDLLRDHFRTEKGARWKVPGSPGGRGGMEYLGDDPAAYTRIYEIKTKDDPKSWADLIAMFRVLNEAPLETLEAALSPLLDIDGVLRFLAIEMALVNSDGYWTRASDYNIYQDEKGRFHVIPHDTNESLTTERGGRGGPGLGGRPGGPSPDGGPVVMPFPPPGGEPSGAGPVMVRLPGPGRGRGFAGRARVDLDPLVGLDDPTKPLRSRLLAVPSLRARYLACVRDIAEDWLDWTTLQPRVQQYQALISEDVKADTRKLYSYEEFQNGISGSENSLKSFVERRRGFLLKVTGTTAELK